MYITGLISLTKRDLNKGHKLVAMVLTIEPALSSAMTYSLFRELGNSFAFPTVSLNTKME